MKSSQSNFDLRSPSSYLARSYLIATVKIKLKNQFREIEILKNQVLIDMGSVVPNKHVG